MQRFLALFVLLAFSVPVGLSITACQTPVGDYCNGIGYGAKKNQVAAIDLEPKSTGISLAWGQTSQLLTPQATSCEGGGNTVAVSVYHYGSSNLQLADVSPNGEVCGGTWNRNSPGGIRDYSICTPPSGAGGGSCTATSCGVVNLTAAAGGVTSNPVPVYVHPPITSISIDPNSSVESQCYSQNTSGPVLSPSGSSPTVTVLGPNGQTINAADVGTISYTAVNADIVNINNTSATGTGVNGATTANMPGSTVINATVSKASSGSAAGYFYTCPPKSIALSVIGSHAGDGVTTPLTVTEGLPINLSATVTDTRGHLINGLSLDYTSTSPENISASTVGQVTTKWPGMASINAVCQPGSCNPAPISKIGVFGTGTPVVSNTLRFTSPGRNSNILWMASTKSQFFSSVDLTTGVPSSPVRLPFIPNSMVMDQAGNNLYFGSYRELMVFSALSNSLSKEDTSVPGIVLAVSPDGAQVVINDQVRQVIYLYSTATKSTTSTTSIAGIATRAEFSPDGKNIYIVGPNSLYVYNQATGWSTYTSGTTPAGPTQPTANCVLNNNTPGSTGYDPFCGPGLALTVPSVGPFVTGSPTTAWGFCPSASGSMTSFYSKAASLGIQTDALAATDDGKHIIAADAADNDLSDINVDIPTGMCPSTDPNQPDGNTAQLGLTLSPAFSQTALGVTVSKVNQVLASPDSSVAFVTYNSSSASGILPAYKLSTTAGQPGTITDIQLSGTAKSPIAGIFSPNGTLFFASSTGDDLVHFIDPTTLADTKTVNPGLLDASGNPVPVEMMAVKPRSTLQ